MKMYEKKYLHYLKRHACFKEKRNVTYVYMWIRLWKTHDKTAVFKKMWITYCGLLQKSKPKQSIK